jgi:hypothetical protein
MVERVENREGYYTYRCKICGFECRKKLIPGSNVPVTKLGDYGDNATPTPTEYADEMYEATTISFSAASGTTPAKISDSAALFGDKHFTGGMPIRVETTSGTNDGDYVIAARGILRTELQLSSDYDLTTENAATAGTVTISRIIAKPAEDMGGACPFCGSLASR